MKNNNSIIGLGLIGLAFGLLYLQNKQAQETRSVQDDFIPAAIEQQVITETSSDDSSITIATEADAFSTAAIEESKAPKIVEIHSDLTLQNEYISVDFTKTGGAIKEIRFLKTKRGGVDDFVFNQGSKITALQLSRRDTDGSVRLLNYTFEIVRSTEHSVIFEYDTGKGVKFVRSYTLEGNGSEQPYWIEHVTTIVNSSTSEPIKIGSNKETELLLTLGTALPVESDKRGEFQAFAYFDGEDDEFIKSTYFTGSKGIFGMGAKEAKHLYKYNNPNIGWAAVKNQFFVSVFTPDRPGTSVYAHSTDVTQKSNGKKRLVGIVGQIAFTPGIIAPQSQYQIRGNYYVGPKEYNRLVRLGEKQDKLMQFGFFGAISKVLLSLMHFIHGIVGNWGISIILMTAMVKGVLWPLTSYSALSSKKMQLLQEPMKEIKVKYADKPERLQRETMALFKTYGVNPLAGCLPMLIQIPIFLGLYWMLRTSSELRYEPFLWIADLSKPDTIATIKGVPLNIMPLLNGVAMFFQMQMMPVSPTADPAQQKIMKYMPLMFLFIMYSFSSGLVLYWTVNSVLSIIQTQMVYRKKGNLKLVPVAVKVPAKTTTTTKRGPNRTPRKKK